MADLITRLKVDSTEYDAKIKRAAQGLQHYVQSAHDSGDVIGRLFGDTKKYVESLGNMATVSTTARGRLNELTAAFTDLRSVYNSLSEEEKSAKGGFGQELNKQLEILKGRINDTKNELKGIDQELGNTKQAEVDTKGGLEGLTNALGINIKTLAGWGTAIAAGKVALDVAKDAFFASESSVDEWGRTVAASQSLYEGFLTAINNGDISGYLSNIDSIVKAARLAYDELDKLGTMKTIQAPQISKQQTENERIRSMIQTGRYIAPQDGRKNAVFNGREMQNGDKLTAGQIRALEKQLQGGMQKMVKLVGNEVDQTGKAINAYYDKLAKTNGMSLQEFKKGTSSWAEFNKRMQGYEDYKKFENEHTSVRERYNPTTQEYESYVIRDQKKNPYQQYAKWGTFRVDKEGDNSYKDLVALIQQRDQQVGQVYSTQAQSYRTMNRAEGLTVRKIMGGTSGKPTKTTKEDIQYADDSIMAQEKLVQKLTQKWKTASGELRDGYLKDLEEAQQKLAEMTGKAKGPDLDKLFPDMSKANFNTGYAGSAQAKYDSARADLALGPMNLDAVNTYIGSIKGMLKDANLGDELYTSMTEKLKDATTVSTLLQEMMERGLAGADLESTAKTLKEKMLSDEGIDQTAIQSFLDELNKQIEEAGGVGLKLNANTGEVTDDKGNGKDDGEDLKKFNEGIGKLSGGLSQVTGGLKSIGVEIPKEVDQVIGVINGVSQIISGVGTIISIFQTSAITANTIALGALTSAVWASVVSNAIPFFSGGGVVPAFAQGGLIGRAAGGMMIPGNSMSGDNLRLPVDGGRGMIGVNSGELILNKSSQNSLAASLLQAESLVDSISDYRVSLGNAQQMSMASELEGGAAAAENTQPFVNGEQIFLGLQAYMRRSGLGEIVTSER